MKTNNLLLGFIITVIQANETDGESLSFTISEKNKRMVLDSYGEDLPRILNSVSIAFSVIYSKTPKEIGIDFLIMLCNSCWREGCSLTNLDDVLNLFAPASAYVDKYKEVVDHAAS